jgi:hypothetical protein
MTHSHSAEPGRTAAARKSSRQKIRKPTKKHAARSISDVASRLPISKDTLRRAVKLGQVKTEKFGGYLRILADEEARIRALLTVETK